jgi:hypothetical protein
MPERHTFLWTGKKFERAQYTGPGTEILTRVKRGDPGLTEVDVVSKAHDIRYTLAKNEEDVRAADKKMLAALRRVKDYKINTLPAYAAIGGKILMENLGIIRKDFFTTYGDFKKMSMEDQQLFVDQEKKLEQEGYGILLDTFENMPNNRNKTAKVARASMGLQFDTFGRRDLPPSTTRIQKEPTTNIAEIPASAYGKKGRKKEVRVRKFRFEPFPSGKRRL